MEHQNYNRRKYEVIWHTRRFGCCCQDCTG